MFLVLDYGNVLTHPQAPEHLESMAALAGQRLDDFMVAYWRHRDAYDRGLLGQEYWRRVLGAPTASSSLLDALIELDVRSWMHYREAVWDLTRQFRARGGRTAMLSNGVREIIARVRLERTLDDWFDAVVVSCDVDCAKPDHEIYDMCLRALGARPSDTLFVDDKTVNLDAADELGIRTFHFAGDDVLPRLQATLNESLRRPNDSRGTLE